MGRRLADFDASIDAPLRQNRMLFDWLADDGERAGLYAELRQADFRVMHFKSVLRGGGEHPPWPDQDVYLLTGAKDIRFALQHFSVEPYRALGSGGRFMLGLDDPVLHDEQNRRAVQALRFTQEEVDACIRLALFRALIRPLDHAEGKFDLSIDVAREAALRFIGFLFGLDDTAHLLLSRLMGGAYQRLSFQIIGRHFTSDSGLPPEGSADVARLKAELEEQIRLATTLPTDPRFRPPGLPAESVITRLHAAHGDDGIEDTVMVALGLMAGTVGNVQAAVSIAIAHFFSERRDGVPMIVTAQRAARSSDEELGKLEALVSEALVEHPPAAFLARTATGERFARADGQRLDIPAGAHVLIALGADPDPSLVFGGPIDDRRFAHRCVGERVARPLITAIVREVLRLPGLSQVIDEATGKPKRLEKRWGVICLQYPLQYKRDLRKNQQPLHLVLPIKEPIAENRHKLKLLIEAGAHVVEEALRESRNVHFAWFSFAENGTHLALSTVYDGDFDAYVEHFAVKVPLFDKQFELLADAPPLPIRDHPKEFLATIRKYNRAPLGNYFFSAYPHTSVSDVHNATGDQP